MFQQYYLHKHSTIAYFFILHIHNISAYKLTEMNSIIKLVMKEAVHTLGNETMDCGFFIHM